MTGGATGWRIRVNGLVQGVGFRPAVWRIANAMGLAGHVSNDGAGVEIAVWCDDASQRQFCQRLNDECPGLARIDGIAIDRLSGAAPADGFIIRASGGGRVRTGIVPDAACCPACLAETLDPAARRYFYPFTNCTHCGPRLSILHRLPYDRASTSMAGFPFCPACRAEYDDPADRRFHAQPIACPDCGPRIWLQDGVGGRVDGSGGDVLARTAALIRAGRIVAIKGIGGFHLACDAGNEQAVTTLRQRKRREDKPFAVMVRDLGDLGGIARCSQDEAAVLATPAAPILLLERLDLADGIIAPSVAPRQQRLGVMLPYTPLHHLLMRLLDRPIVLTSANRSGEPQCAANEEALADLAGIADHWLMHDRDIVNRLDDSVLRQDGTGTTVLRAARGFAPGNLLLPAGLQGGQPLLAVGGDLKAAFCLAGGEKALLSQYLGDLVELKTEDAWRHCLTLYRDLFDASPQSIVCDLHPGYRSTRIARELAEQAGVPLVQVQHHHAHLASNLASNLYPVDAPPVIGVVLDGLGYGDDGTLWGGEFLLGHYSGYQRLAHFAPIAMPGGDRASREPWRNLLAHLAAAWGSVDAAPGTGLLGQRPVAAVEQMIRRGVNSPLASSAGRLFDAVAACLGICPDQQSYEGQAATELEALAEPFMTQTSADDWPVPDGERQVLQWRWLWDAILQDLSGGQVGGLIAARVHHALIRLVSQTAVRLARQSAASHIALSGGVFQNRLLLLGVSDAVIRAGLIPLVHGRVPANDGGLALGQAAVGLST